MARRNRTTSSGNNTPLERSIGTLNENLTRFDRSIEVLTRSIGTFQESVGTFNETTTTQSRGGGRAGGRTPTPSRRSPAAARSARQMDRFNKDASKLGMGKLNDFTNNVFGKRATMKMNKSIAKGLGYLKAPGGVGGGGTAGMMGKAMGGLGSLAGGVLRMAGPIGAIASVAKMAFDFWDSGGVAKLKIGAKMLTGNKMMGQDDIANVQKDLEGTEQMRKLNAEYNYKVPMQLRQQAGDDMLNYNKSLEQDKLNYDQGLVKDKLDYQLGLTKDALNFQFQQAMESLDAELSKRKDIQASGMSFIGKYSTISERALKAIGSSTKQIIEGIGKFQSIFGGSVKDSFKLNENAAGLAYHFGGSADDVMNMTNMFRLMGKTSGETAQNLIAGITQFANLNNLAPQAIFNQIKDAGEDIYKFSNGTAENFVRQAALLSKMSVSMSQMTKASDSMVLNYKDSMKAEMSLSAMLGKNVNLSEVRAKLMAGDQAGGAQALKSALGGVDINTMNAFQKQALTQATGMDISALMGLQQGKGGELTGELKAEKNKGKAFADGALSQDISNAGAKLKMEQEQRAKLLAVEQRQRMIMLTLEQAQRLDGVFMEQKWRAIIAERGYDKAKEEMAVDMIAEQAANFGSNLMSGTSSSLNKQGLTDASIQQFTAAVQGTDNSLTNLISSGAIKGTDMRLADYLTKKDEILANATNKTPQQIQEAITTAYTSMFAKEEKARQEAFQLQKAREENIAKEIVKAQGTGGDFEDYKEKYKVSQAEIDSAKKLLNQQKETHYASAGMGGAYSYETTKYSMNDKAVVAAKVDSSAQAVKVDPAAQVKVATDGNKPVVDVVASNGTKQLAAQGTITTKQEQLLTESQYGVKLQQETVALLGLNAQILNKIMENTADGGDITLYGKTLTSTLLSQARKNYGVARTA
jgi:hypothetical protein